MITEVITDLRTSGTVETPTDTKIEDIQSGKPASKAKAWKNPGTLHHKMYLKGDVVSHRNRLWVSTHDGLNHWEPGAEGIDERIWAEVPVEEAQPEVETPTPEAEKTTPVKPSTPKWKSGVNYSKGDKVLYKGTIYEVVQPHTSAGHWTPDAVASLYKRV